MQVMILEEADGQRLFDVSTQERLNSVALAIVNARFSTNFYEKPVEPVKPDMSRKEIYKIKDKQIKEYGLMKWKDYNEACKDYDKHLLRYQYIQSCVNDKDGVAAFEVLKFRSQFQSEGVQVVTVHDYYQQ